MASAAFHGRAGDPASRKPTRRLPHSQQIHNAAVRRAWPIFRSRRHFPNRPIISCAARPACSKRLVPSRNVAAATRLECSIVRFVSLPQIVASLCVPGLFDMSACGLQFAEPSNLGSIFSMGNLVVKGVMASVVRLQGAADFTCTLLLRRPCWSGRSKDRPW